ncbi:DUF3419 family protein [Hymenobacter caeli]|uniref:S-adenosylmethionine-diacylglycerol 3-amino-3-carboxypropyl transferase n=1 Tax=Hymenobacter caeli TaxID=2735894 RepID=A0ABX2FQA9_9BACT|nr:DUF3419 family protein [Hymenobacter caeli]NRT18604.1 S-adenosylmethionine-diacylglycerol 3-amino-3-carboxypropyl transferase [Hymenobacter caeli]
MKSEFQALVLDSLRYALVWESSATLHGALRLGPADHALVVTGAGCNVLNALLTPAARVTAIDLNPAQNALLRLKQHVVALHPYPVFRGLLGLDGPGAVAAAWPPVRATLPAPEQEYWGAFFAANPAGIFPAGRLESYVTAFLPTLAPARQAALRQLLAFDAVGAQAAFFRAELEPTDFREQFIQYFDDANLSKGRDARLFAHATESGGAAFYERLRRHLGAQLARDNFFFRFFFFGPEGLPQAVLPPCYQAANYLRLRARLPALRIRTGEATDFLLSLAGQDVTKASLSNIFEYVSAAEFARVCRALGQRPGPLRLVFWNLLQAQAGAPAPGVPLQAAESARLSAAEGCFYFRDVRVLAWEAAAVPTGATGG